MEPKWNHGTKQKKEKEMREIQVLAEVSALRNCFKLKDVNEEPSAVANIIELVIDINDSIETAANTTGINTGACKESELANVSKLVMTSYHVSWGRGIKDNALTEDE